MPTFGFSFLLKILSMNDKPQLTELRKRLTPSDGDGYDFHNSLRRFAARLLVEGEPLEDLLKEVEAIKKEAERSSVKAGLKRLADWRAANDGQLVDFPAQTFASPDELFKIRFKPDFGIVLDGKRTAVHLWNAQAPKLISRMVYGSLALLPLPYTKIASPPDDFAVLSLRDLRLYRLSDAPWTSAMGPRIYVLLEARISKLLKTIKPPPKRDEDRPPA